jgi:hypothetical protein
MTITTHLRSRLRLLLPVALVAVALAVASSLATAGPASAADATVAGYAKVGPANGHLQEAWATLYRASNSLTEVTHTDAYTWFGGYTGGSFAILRNAAGQPIYTTHIQGYGVSGSLFGNNDRYDTYTEAIPPEIAAQTASIDPQLIWAPTWRLLKPTYDLICWGLKLFNVQCPPFPA